MYRRCREKEYYFQVLENNLNFLKLSFIPLTFLVTILGFFCTLTGLNVQEIDIKYLYYINEVINDFFDFPKNQAHSVSNLISCFISLIKGGAFMIILLYFASIPVQLVSYFVILLIKYFSKYNMAYKKIFNFYISLLGKFYVLFRKFLH